MKIYLQVVLALFGRSLGVRRLYVRVLLAIFQVYLKNHFNGDKLYDEIGVGGV